MRSKVVAVILILSLLTIPVSARGAEDFKQGQLSKVIISENGALWELDAMDIVSRSSMTIVSNSGLMYHRMQRSRNSASSLSTVPISQVDRVFWYRRWGW